MSIRFTPMLPEVDWPLVKNRLGLKWVEDSRGILAVDGTVIVAGAIFNNWTYSSVQVHMWIDKPIVIRRGFFEEIANYVFNTAERDRMVAFVPGHLDEALKLNRHIGFIETYRIKNGFMFDTDYVIMEADRAALARWLPQEERDGRQRRSEGPGLQGSRGRTGGCLERHQHPADVGESSHAEHSMG